jgi:hypothetical protein
LVLADPPGNLATLLVWKINLYLANCISPLSEKRAMQGWPKRLTKAIRSFLLGLLTTRGTPNKNTPFTNQLIHYLGAMTYIIPAAYPMWFQPTWKLGKSKGVTIPLPG